MYRVGGTHRLDVLDLNNEDIAWFSSLNLKWAREIVDLGQVDIQHIICTVVISNLAASPVQALDLHNLAILDGSTEGH
jgi:hypothetical protein